MSLKSGIDSIDWSMIDLDRTTHSKLMKYNLQSLDKLQVGKQSVLSF